MEERKKNNSFLGNIGNSIMNGADYFVTKVDDIGSFATGLALLPAEYLDEELEGSVTDYLNENEEYRNFLAGNIRKRKEEIDLYTESNPVKGVFLRVGTSAIEEMVDPLQFGMNRMGTGFIMNAVTNTLDYVREQKVIYGREISDFGVNDTIGIGMSVGMAGLASKFEVPDAGKPLYDEIKIKKVYDIQTDKNKAPLDKIVEVKEEVGSVVDYKSAGEIVKRIESGQTQSIPQGYHNGKRILETIDKGTAKRIEQISDIWKSNEMDNKYKKNPKIEVDTSRDIAVKGAVAEAMKPLYSEIELGQRQVLGEIADKLVGWNIKNKKYDGITPIGDIIEETIDGISDDEFIKIFQNKNKNEKYNELSSILHNWLKESVEIKSKSQILNKDDGFYFDSVYNKQHLMNDLHDFIKNPELLSSERANYIKGQLKNIGKNVYIDDATAKQYGYKKGGYFNLEKNPELINELYKDIHSTTQDHAEAFRKGVVKDKEKSLLDVAIKWTNSSIYLEGKEKYNNILKLKREEMTAEDIKFKEMFEQKALEKLESAFKGYEKPGREIVEDVISTIVDERSGYNVFKNKFEKFIDEPESKLINNNPEKDTNIGFLMEIKADGEVEGAIKESIKSVKGSLKSINKIKPKNYDELSLADKVICNMKNTAAYKLLFGIRHFRESAPNIGLVNSGGIKLGFKKQYSYIKGMYEMGKAHYDLSKNLENILKRDLSSISDPFERFEVELFIRRNLENNYAFDKKHIIAKTLQKGSQISGSGQLVSDIHRITMAVRFTTKAMFDELPKLKFEEMSPTMRSVLKSNGIDSEMALESFQKEISKFSSQVEFDDFILNTNIGKGGKLKSIFEQFVDITGREFEPFEKDLTNIDAKGMIPKLLTNSQMLFKRYSMGAFSRAWKNATTYYDGDDILRYKFRKNNNFQWDSFSKNNWKNSIQGFGRRNGINLMKMSALLWTQTQAINWAQGKMFGTSKDEMVEAKFEALKTDAVPIVAEGLIESMADYVGYDIMFGGTPALVGLIAQTSGAMKRNKSSENLETSEKIMYGLAYVFLPQNISSGIDNLKFERNIPTKINTFSTDAQFLWKHYYRKDAEYEQIMGEFPAEKLAGGIKESFKEITDWYDYFHKNPNKVYDVLGKGTEGDKEAMITLATGIMELTEQSARSEHINYAFAHEEPEEREKALEEYGLDYKTLLSNLDTETRDLFHYIMAFQGVQDPLYLIQALEYINVSKDKKRALSTLLDDYEREPFEAFREKIEKNIEKKYEIAERDYEDSTEGYIDFLYTLRTEI